MPATKIRSAARASGPGATTEEQERSGKTMMNDDKTTPMLYSYRTKFRMVV